MKKLVLLLLVVLGSNGLVKAQYSMDFGLNLGGSTYVGEIGDPGETDDIENPFPFYIIPRAARYNVGLFYRFNINRNIAARFEVNWVRVAGADSLSTEPSRIGRNLSFRTDIYEFSLQGEYAWLTRDDLGRGGNVDFRADAHAGIGYMWFNPMGQLNGEWYNLRPLATEGLDNQYKKGSLIIPIGAGVSWIFNDKLRVGMDLTYRFTFTDYIDDISTDYAFQDELPYVESYAFSNRSAEVYSTENQDLPDPSYYKAGEVRGNPETNDGYFMVQFKVSYVLELGNQYSRYKSKRRRGRY
ncbi:MAG: hypothetical protein CMP59_00400 [Flavobacteriales bacterium]|nr:hypothetical protein [Flavobacteriales bacterium]|tara:strand:- start:1739 stop:2632 length:894 start_codon:yes stop_codon:yes gene_type:complete